MYDTLAGYCAFTKEDSEMCKELGGAKYSGSGIVYKHDEYLNKSATIPSQRSVLLRKCNLDPITAP
ncbi:hypothetical protein F441_16431 [Phytophthora nicotianae CJ01A1]|uniref:Uncharacterized protein n=5 Tax=Phytophthora nicotianae TaxID=4792 RepID=V9EFS3_PHYNI|nr:hypothetical protein F443_16624 [Phytophthora nicotianae P1569]ETK77597.1 hypothetical protein L915_16156 [Phytophthora nicotianae]ETO66172.1 hypothetical protein F444_16580 [Phytophthora nicotianae P1976]ETP07252.1 hypothetical protein F441_16431 [Phytophthora nicotianae CJ01A1]ETP27558.1 hypothetical protein F442_23166 [Phytophthora nicotianae P10297]